MPTRAKCTHCGKAFTPATYWQRYCSKKCRTYVSVSAFRERQGTFKTRRPRIKAKYHVVRMLVWVFEGGWYEYGIPHCSS